jgi:hypothetical protein
MDRTCGIAVMGGEKESEREREGRREGGGFFP